MPDRVKLACECDDDMGCPSCCEYCEAATGGQCFMHAEPECTCYEATYGHQPGCYFNRRLRGGADA